MSPFRIRPTFVESSVRISRTEDTYAASVPTIDNHRVFMLRVLSLLESRVLGVLIEKERTVPDSYPLTLNALVAGDSVYTESTAVLEI